MFEIELKFQISEEKKSALIKAFQRKNTQTKILNAKYFDTAQFELSQLNISLRQRLENDEWFQTLKLPTEHHLKRVEFEDNLGKTETTLQIDNYLKSKHIPKRIKSFFTHVENPLTIHFQTQIERKLTLFKFQNSEIEVSFDQGKIISNQQSINISELEFELKQGTVQDLISFILPRVKRYGLWLDTRSKSQQGFQLAQNIQDNPVQFQIPLHLDNKESQEIALKKILINCLQHLLPNSSAIASGHFDSKHVHQARVAIRRLRSALKTFSNWSSHIDPTWQIQLTELFRQLGSTRDLDMIREELLPRLQEANAPKFKFVDSPVEDSQKLTQLFRSFNFNYLILSLLQFIYQKSDEKSKGSVHKAALNKLSKLHHHIQTDAEKYLDLSIEQRHKTRKNLKRLRYSIEFVSSLCDESSLKNYIKAIKPAQESLGLYNDMIVAEAFLNTLVKSDPKVLFALGWIAAEKNHLLIQSQQNLLNFAKVKALE